MENIDDEVKRKKGNSLKGYSPNKKMLFVCRTVIGGRPLNEFRF